MSDILHNSNSNNQRVSPAAPSIFIFTASSLLPPPSPPSTLSHSLLARSHVTDLLASHRHQPKVRRHALPQIKCHLSVLPSPVIATLPRKIRTFFLSTARMTTHRVSASHNPASLVVHVALARVAICAPPQTHLLVLLDTPVLARLICILIPTCPTHPQSHQFLPY